MDEDRTAQEQIAPLQIKKSSRDVTPEEQQHGSTQDLEMSTFEENYIPRPRFQNFLRASYPFQPTATPSPSTVTLGLNAGDIILVHSIHTNGWADGTLLETGARGWLPTNYCEPYDYATMRPLLKAVTEFWDMIRNGSAANAVVFHNHDYMRGMVAGVRFLLEKSDCLTRDSRLVKKHDSIRKIRKALLADLSNLVKTSKQMQQLVVSDSTFSDMDEVLDDMMLKAFQVVTRAVNFFDCWSEEVTYHEPIRSESSVSMSRRSVAGLPQVESAPATTSVDQADLGTSQPPTHPVFEDSYTKTERRRPESIHSSRLTISHRMSYIGRPGQCQLNQDLASEKLNTMYDAFLGVLASFLGSHMQSRSSSELLLTTHQAVKACRRLLNVVETIIEHGLASVQSLVEAKDAMYDKITELVFAAKQVFRPLQTSEDEMIYRPSEGIHLVSAATACVSSAGRCVAKARAILEDMGDFELEMTPETEQTSPIETQRDPDLPPVNSSQLAEVDSSSLHGLSSKPQLEIITAAAALTPMNEMVVTPETSTFWKPNPDFVSDSPMSTTSSNIESHAAVDGSNMQPRGSSYRPFMRNIIHSTASESTLVSSIRDSGPSFVSDTSTRATSPERNSKPLPLTPDLGGEIKPSPIIEDTEDDESAVMEHYFAHELMFNAEGRVIGGSLNAIIERLTAHDSTPDAFFVSTIYLTFRLFTTPKEFAEGLAYRFKYIEEASKIAGPVQLRVYNILKGWLESHWRHDCDEVVLPYIAHFAKDSILPVLPAAGRRLIELTDTVAQTHQPPLPRVLSSLGKTNTSSADYLSPDQPLPSPILSKTQLSALKTWKMGGSAISILDFDPLELARQITVKESALFCSILPEELLSTEFTKQSNSLAVNVRAMAQLSTDLANLVADSILVLEEPKKRAATIKQWIKVANKCLELNNYDTLMAIICSINSSTILRLKRTWDLVNQKTKNLFEGLKHVVDVSKNYSTLRQRISGHVPPCLPFVGMYLTDLTFVDHGNSNTRQLKIGDSAISVINLDKHMKTAKVISDLQRFQTPYRLNEVSELQTWLQDELIRVRAAGERNFQNHYRRSLVLEPRETAQSRPTTISTFGSFTGKEKFDFLAWTHMSKDKTTPVSS